jgi:hypothetical protein
MCQYMSRLGLLKLSELKLEPQSGGTWCGDACSCTLKFYRATTVSVGQ